MISNKRNLQLSLQDSVMSVLIFKIATILLYWEVPNQSQHRLSPKRSSTNQNYSKEYSSGQAQILTWSEKGGVSIADSSKRNIQLTFGAQAFHQRNVSIILITEIEKWHLNRAKTSLILKDKWIKWCVSNTNWWRQMY